MTAAATSRVWSGRAFPQLIGCGFALSETVIQQISHAPHQRAGQKLIEAVVAGEATSPSWSRRNQQVWGSCDRSSQVLAAAAAPTSDPCTTADRASPALLPVSGFPSPAACPSRCLRRSGAAFLGSSPSSLPATNRAAYPSLPSDCSRRAPENRRRSPVSPHCRIAPPNRSVPSEARLRACPRYVLLAKTAQLWSVLSVTAGHLD